MKTEEYNRTLGKKKKTKNERSKGRHTENCKYCLKQMLWKIMGWYEENRYKAQEERWTGRIPHDP